MKAGIGMDSVFVDEPFELECPTGTIWRPMNWDNKFYGPMTLVRALTTSSNIIAIKLLLKIGGNYIAPWAQPFGITRALTSYPSAALGTAEATVEENVAAFNVFANNGVYVKPTLVEWVKNEHGIKIWQPENITHRVLDSRLSARMINLLSQRMIRAKKYSKDGWFDADSIGKTGSTNGAATTWFVGATPTLTTALYIGRDDNKPLPLLAGRTTVPIWTKFYKSLTFDKKHFRTDPTLREVAIDWYTGQPSDDADDPNVITLLQ
jgi:penicillin-binding protein 1A